MALSSAVREIVEPIQRACSWEQLRFQLSKPTRRAEWMNALANLWTKAEAVELLDHEAPSVRGYVAYEIVRQFPESASLIRQIWSDDSRVRWISLDYGEPPLSSMLADDLCELASPAADAELLWAVKNANAAFPRDRVLLCVRKRRPIEAASAAFDVLQASENVEAIHTLGFDPIPAYLPLVRRLAQSASPQSRRAALIALSAFDSEAAKGLLQPLATDPDPNVRLAAQVITWRMDQTRTAELKRVLTSNDGSERIAAEALAWFPTSKSLAIMETYLVAHPDDEIAMRALIAQRPSTTLLNKMRGWAMHIWRSSIRYNEVLLYLIQAKDAGAAHVFDEALRTGDWRTSILGARGLGSIGAASTPYIRNLEKALAHNNAFVVVGAADALLTLEAAGSIPQLRHAQERIPNDSWAKQYISGIISKLESLP